MKLYELYRTRIEHEDNLINHRTGWFITLQSFLFTSSALVAARLGDIAYANFVSILAGVGVAIAITTFLSVFAAHRAIRGMIDFWNEKKWHLDDKNAALLPAIAGSGKGFLAITRGKVSSIFMPPVIVFAWLWMFVFVHFVDCNDKYIYIRNAPAECLVLNKKDLGYRYSGETGSVDGQGQGDVSQIRPLKAPTENTD